jgi:hypothetical protein
MTSSNASLSPPIRAVIWMRALPIALATASNFTSTALPAPIAADCLVCPVMSRIAGSRLLMVTVALPFAFSWLVTTAPNDARSPRARKRGNAGFIVSGLLTRISLSALPKRDALSAATAMIR